MSDLPDPWPILSLAGGFTAAGLAIASAEWLAPWSKLAPDGLARSASHGCDPGWWRREGPHLAMVARFVLSCVLVVLLVMAPVRSAAVTLVVTSLVIVALPLRLSEPLGIRGSMNGAEHVLTANLLALALACLAGTAPAAIAAAAFITLRALIEYAAAGWLKLTALRQWASGRNLGLVLRTPDYGHAPLAHALESRPSLLGAASVLIILVEILMPAALLLPHPWAEALLLCAFGFHAVVAFVMGLNTFLWAFAATYPVILYCRDVIALAL